LARLTFISDLHLHTKPGGVDAHFAALLAELRARQERGEAQALYVVGDLFSFWTDRALVARLYAAPLDQISELARSGCRVTILEGNRDFGFAGVLRAATGAELAGEEHMVVNGDEKALLLHGDQLLTADRRYQVFKRVVRSFPARLAARILPSPLLLWAVRRLERVSSREKARKTSEQMQVDDEVSVRRMQAAGARFLIHGHTHEPGRRQVALPAGEGTCFNLGEWNDEGGVILDWPEGSGPRLVHWPSDR